MRSILHFTLFFVFFFVDVHVQAKTLNFNEALDVVQLPENCLKSLDECAIMTGRHEKYKLDLRKNEIVLSENTVIVIKPDGDLKFVSGTVWVRNKETIKVELKSGFVSANEESDFWVINSDRRTVIRNMKGEVFIHPAGASEVLFVKPHFENWIGGRNEKGIVATGIPTAIDIRDTLKLSAELFYGKKEAFKKLFTDLQEQWPSVIEESVELQTDIATRELASIENKKAKDLEDKKNRQREKARIREMYLKKLYDY